MAIMASALGMPLASSVVPSTGSTATSNSGPVPAPDLLAVVQHRRLVLLAFADDDHAAERDRAQQQPHLVDGRLVAALLVAPAGPPAGGHRRGFGDSHQVQAQVAVGATGRARVWVIRSSS